MASEWMGTQVLKNVETAFCNIETPDTTYYKGGKKRTKPPQWKVPVIVDRDNEEMMKLFRDLRDFLIDNGEEIAEGEEPWVRTQEAKTKTNDDGQEITYPEYEFISVMTSNDPHEKGLVVDSEGKPFTSEIWKGSDVNIAFSPKYDTVHNYLITFYLSGVKVNRNGSGNGGGGGASKDQVMQLLGVPFGNEESSSGSDDAPFDPSQL